MKRKKKREKKHGAVNVLATAKTVSRYNGVLYRDMAFGCAVRLGGLYCER